MPHAGREFARKWRFVLVLVAPAALFAGLPARERWAAHAAPAPPPPATGAARSPATVPVGPEWVLAWSDEFDGAAINESKWTVEDWASTRNRELHYYAPDEVYLENGCLRLRSRRREHAGRPFTSGAVNSKGKFSQTFGRFEVRARLPCGKGVWPAHWMLPQAGQWPPEIDITEVLGHEPSKVHLTHHWGTGRARKEKTAHFVGPDFSADFHVFAVEWERGQIRWLVDGVERSRSETPEAVPAEPFYLLLNTAVGGQWPGNPDETTVFPQYHDIDYVRVYRRRDSNVKPTVRITTPPGQSRRGALGDPLRWKMPKPGEDMILTASVSDADLKGMKVEYSAAGEKIGDSATPPYRAVWKGVKAGTYELTARAVDAKGESVTSPPVQVEVK